MITANTLKDAFVAISDCLSEHRSELNELDSNIGDSDHGESVCRAFEKAAAVAKQAVEDDVGVLLKQVGFSILSTGGAAMGPLYGTALMDAGKNLAGKQSLDKEDVGIMLQSMQDGIARRGKASVGDKTMLDSLAPAVRAFCETQGLKGAIEAAVGAARAGMESTAGMQARIGRASRLQKRSIGHIDPGSASMYYVIGAMLGTFFESSNR